MIKLLMQLTWLMSGKDSGQQGQVYLLQYLTKATIFHLPFTLTAPSMTSAWYKNVTLPVLEKMLPVIQPAIMFPPKRIYQNHLVDRLRHVFAPSTSVSA